jgi:hypothetical protein
MAKSDLSRGVRKFSLKSEKRVLRCLEARGVSQANALTAMVSSLGLGDKLLGRLR